VAHHTTTTTTTMITAYRSLGQLCLMILLCLVSACLAPGSQSSIMQSLTVYARHRISPYPQIPLDDALKKIMNEIKPLGLTSLPVSEGLDMSSAI